MVFDFHSAIYWFGQIAVFVFAITGALSAAKREMDILAFIFVGTVTGIGGGTLRDLLLNVEVFWIVDPLYLSVCIVGSVATYFFAHWMVQIDRLLLWMDAAGISLFAVLGTGKALALGASPLVSVLMGVATSTVGSVVRDMMLQQKVIIFEPEIYVTACLLGGSCYLGLSWLGLPDIPAILISSGAAFTLRVLAIQYDLRFPHYKLTKLQSREIKRQEKE